MTLSSGTRIGPYEIVAPLGVGGMGEVYRATDTNLKRQVAVKVLPASFAADPERLARFQREAEVLAALNHPNIAHIHGLERSDGTIALIMELVDGPTLADRIAQGPIPITDALPIATQIADALEAAHEQGIVHRDLKPANIKVRADGTAKVLDFGLAKALDPGGGLSSTVSMSPTITSPAMTQAGIILGTAAYMAPEQARGKAIDKRADIWAFGCVLFEMLTARRAFEGDEIADTLAFVITRDPNWNLLPPTTPGSVRKLLARTLEKDRKRRLADIADARFELEEAKSARSIAAPAAEITPPRASGTFSRALPWILSAASAVALVWILVQRAPWRVSTPAAPIRLTANIGVDASLANGIGNAMALSPDGRTVVFAAQKSPDVPTLLYVRHLDQLDAVALAGTEDASQPFFAPDGHWVAYFAGGKLKKIALAGGPAVTLAEAVSPRGGDWADDDTIVFLPAAGGGAGLFQVPAGGGKTDRAIPPDVNSSQRWPQVLAGHKALLYTSNSPAEGQRLMVRRFPDGPSKVLQSNAAYGRYLGDGQLIFLRGITLFAAPFDVNALEITGAPVPILEGIANVAQNNGAQFAVSASGALVYVPGASEQTNRVPIVWMDATGKATPLMPTPSDWANPNFSPDGRKLAMDVLDAASGNVDINVYDLERETLNRLTSDAQPDATPEWTPDGKRLVYRSLRLSPAFPYNIFWQPADGTGVAERLTESREPQIAGSWHPSGKFLAFDQANGAGGKAPVMILPFDGSSAAELKPGKPYIFQTGDGNAQAPTFSPDGKFLAFTSFRSGRPEIYVRPFPGPGGEWVISNGGGNMAAWSRARQELFFNTLGPDNHVMVVPYRIEGDAFVPGRAREWSPVRFLSRRGRGWALHPDGNRVAMGLIPETVSTGKQNTLVFVFNFLDEVRRSTAALKR
jgi:serine/threonine-protein kinase